MHSTMEVTAKAERKGGGAIIGEHQPQTTVFPHTGNQKGGRKEKSTVIEFTELIRTVGSVRPGFES